MFKPLLNGLLGALLFCPVLCFSQDEVQVDTVISTNTLNEEPRDTGFGSLGQPLPVSTRTVPQQKLDSLRREDAFWYANLAPQKKSDASVNTNKSSSGKKVVPDDSTDADDESFSVSKPFQQLLWIIVLCGFIGIVLWYLSSSNILLFRKRAKKIAPEEETEQLTDDIFSIQYDKEIAKAAAAKNFRLAVRLWYLQMLKILSYKGLIDYRYGRTNNDYLSQLLNTPHHRHFFRLTRNFEYTWYGQFEPSGDAYEMMQADFANFKKAVGG